MVGHGLNAAELARNPRLNTFFVRDLNKDPTGWAFQDSSFDAVVCCVRCAGSWLGFLGFEEPPKLQLARAWNAARVRCAALSAPQRAVSGAARKGHGRDLPRAGARCEGGLVELVASPRSVMINAQLSADLCGAAPGTGGVLILTFSNRMFPTKAIRAWVDADSGYARVQVSERSLTSREGAFA